MTVEALSTTDLVLAAALIMALAGLTLSLKLRMERTLLIAGVRTIIQLTLVGYVLKWIFNHFTPLLLSLAAVCMVTMAGWEVIQRQKVRFVGFWGFSIGTFSMFLSSLTMTVIGLTLMISVDPWYQPQYSIPLLGMLLGNTMNGIALGLDQLTSRVWNNRQVIEGQLALGYTCREAMSEIRRDCMRSALTPIINTMSVIGIVSLPGMMTGQILAGTSPMIAVQYQIMILFLIAAGIGFGSAAAIWAGSHRLFDQRQRLRQDRLRLATQRK